MPEIILITLAKNLFHILKNGVGNQKSKKIVKGGVHPPINPSPIKSLKLRLKEKQMTKIKNTIQIPTMQVIYEQIG